MFPITHSTHPKYAVVYTTITLATENTIEIPTTTTLGYVYINPHTFENRVCISKHSAATLAFSNIFQKLLIQTETLENMKFAVHSNEIHYKVIKVI